MAGVDPFHDRGDFLAAVADHFRGLQFVEGLDVGAFDRCFLASVIFIAEQVEDGESPEGEEDQEFFLAR